jgi:ABC-type dipeptide/oligopeptide/nickel transport system permease component
MSWHLVVPALALALPIAATFERLQAQALGEVAGEPLPGGGLRARRPADDVRWRHAWPASWRPLVRRVRHRRRVAALRLVRGRARHRVAGPRPADVRALRARDIYLVAGCAASGAMFLALGSLIGDLMLASADPRVTENEA